jgi:membrane-associated protein
VIELAASFDSQLSALAPFIFYIIVGAIVFVETGILLGFFLPGDSILFSAGLVAAAHGNINIVILVSIIFLAAFFGDQVGFVIGRVYGRPY